MDFHTEYTTIDFYRNEFSGQFEHLTDIELTELIKAASFDIDRATFNRAKPYYLGLKTGISEFQTGALAMACCYQMDYLQTKRERIDAGGEIPDNLQGVSLAGMSFSFKDTDETTKQSKAKKLEISFDTYGYLEQSGFMWRGI